MIKVSTVQRCPETQRLVGLKWAPRAWAAWARRLSNNVFLGRVFISLLLDSWKIMLVIGPSICFIPWCSLRGLVPKMASSCSQKKQPDVLWQVGTREKLSLLWWVFSAKAATGIGLNGANWKSRLPFKGPGHHGFWAAEPDLARHLAGVSTCQWMVVEGSLVVHCPGEVNYWPKIQLHIEISCWKTHTLQGSWKGTCFFPCFQWFKRVHRLPMIRQ